MAEDHREAAELLFDGDVFVYRGGRVPENLRERITRARIDKSVKIIDARAFDYCTNLLDVETHNGITKVKRLAFCDCRSLRGIKLPGVREVEEQAFLCCYNMTDAEFGVELETIGGHAFRRCDSLRRIAIPLKGNIFPLDTVYRQTQFILCHKLTAVDLVGGIHKTISSLHLESWRDEMKGEIDRINQVLLYTDDWEETSAIQQWIDRVINRMEHYKTQHNTLLKEATTLLELALWKAKLGEDKSEEDPLKNLMAKKSKIDDDSARQESRITSGASIVINNVLPFLQLA